MTQANYPAPAPYNGEVHAWTYDALGNRLTNTVNGVPQTYTYFKNGSNPLNGQRLSSDSVNTYTYNPNGNSLTRNGSGGNFTFGWDYDDRMTSISGAATASYTYDYQGRRTSKTVSGSTTTYLYDGLNLIRASGSSTGDYLFGPGIDEPLAMSQSGSVYYFAADGLGSVNLLTDTSGAMQDAYLYDAWGVVKSQTGTLANDFGYTAREFGEAGLWFYRARYYQAGIGRFTQEDPIRLRGGPTLFAYARSAPVLRHDPLGTSDASFLERFRGCRYYFSKCADKATKCGDDRRRKEVQCANRFGDDPEMDERCGQPTHVAFSTDTFVQCWLNIPECQKTLEKCGMKAITGYWPGMKIPWDRIPKPQPTPMPPPTPCPGQ